MGAILWRRGEFRAFRVISPDIHLGGETPRVLHQGDVIEFDGQVVRYASEEFAFPQLKKVIERETWLIPDVEGEESEVEYAPRASERQVQRAYHEDQEVSTMKQWNERHKAAAAASDDVDARKAQRIAALQEGRDVEHKVSTQRQAPKRVVEEDGRPVKSGNFKGRVVGELQEQEGVPVATLASPKKSIDMSKDPRKLVKEILPEPARIMRTAAQEEPVFRGTIRDPKSREQVSYMRESESLTSLLGDENPEVVGNVTKTATVQSSQRGTVDRQQVAPNPPKPRRKIEVIQEEEEPIQWDMKQHWKTRVTQLLEWYEKDIQVFEDLMEVEKDAVRKHVLMALEKEKENEKILLEEISI